MHCTYNSTERERETPERTAWPRLGLSQFLSIDFNYIYKGQLVLTGTVFKGPFCFLLFFLELKKKLEASCYE